MVGQGGCICLLCLMNNFNYFNIFYHLNLEDIALLQMSYKLISNKDVNI